MTNPPSPNEALREALGLVFRIEAAGVIMCEAENFERWKETARRIAPILRALSPLSGEPAPIPETPAGKNSRCSGGFTDQEGSVGGNTLQPASVAGEAVAIIAAFRDKFSADWLDRLFGPDMKRRMDAALSETPPPPSQEGGDEHD